jgi:hypothetical protein
MEANFNKFGCKVTDEEGKVLMRGIRTKNNCYKWIPKPEAQTEMLNTVLEHQENLALPHLGSGIERRSASENNSSLKDNQGIGQLYLIKKFAFNSVSTEDSLIDKCTKILNLKKCEKLKDRLDISLKREL